MWPKNWEELLTGKIKELKIFAETDLHYEFGNSPWEYIIKVEISKVE